MESSKIVGPCKVSDGYIGTQGYGRVQVGNGKARKAHVVLWEQVNGPVPAGLVLDHLCRNRACVNLDHLEPVTVRENTLRGIGPSALNAKKTHCKHGHEFAGDNLEFDHKGDRRCATCRRRTSLAYKARVREKKKLSKKLNPIEGEPTK